MDDRSGFAAVSRAWCARASGLSSGATKVLFAVLSMPYLDTSAGWSGTYEAIRASMGSRLGNAKIRAALQSASDAGLVGFETSPRVRVWLQVPGGPDESPEDPKSPQRTRSRRVPGGPDESPEDPKSPQGTRSRRVPGGPDESPEDPNESQGDPNESQEDPNESQGDPNGDTKGSSPLSPSPTPPPSNPSSPNTIEGARPTINKERPAPRRKQLWRFVPSDWSPSKSHRELAASLGVNLEFEAAKFRDHEFVQPRSDADRAFSNWIRRAASGGPGRMSSTPIQPNSGYDFDRFRQGPGRPK